MLEITHISLFFCVYVPYVKVNKCANVTYEND